MFRTPTHPRLSSIRVDDMAAIAQAWDGGARAIDAPAAALEATAADSARSRPGAA